MKIRTSQRRVAASAAVAALAVSTLAACSGGGGEADSEGQSIVVQTTDTIPDRVAATEEIIANFEADTGIQVEFGDTEKIFSNPSDERTENYITGRFG